MSGDVVVMPNKKVECKEWVGVSAVLETVISQMSMEENVLPSYKLVGLEEMVTYVNSNIALKLIE